MLKILKFVLNDDDLNGRFIITPTGNVGEILTEYDRNSLVRFIEADRNVERFVDNYKKYSPLFIDADSSLYNCPHGLYHSVLKGTLKDSDYVVYSPENTRISKLYIDMTAIEHIMPCNNFIASFEYKINRESKDIFKYIKSDTIYEGVLSVY